LIPCHWTLTLFWKFILFSKSIEPDKEAVATLLAFATNSTPLGCSRPLTPFADGGIQLLLVAREPRQRAVIGRLPFITYTTRKNGSIINTVDNKYQPYLNL